MQRPAADMRRVVYFPADGDKPTFRWLETEDVGDYQMMQIDGTNLNDAYHHIDCAINFTTKELLPWPIWIMYVALHVRLKTKKRLLTVSPCPKGTMIISNSSTRLPTQV